VEFCNEEVAMAETGRMAEEATRMGKEVQEHGQRMGREYHRAAESGFGRQADHLPKLIGASRPWQTS